MGERKGTGRTQLSIQLARLAELGDEIPLTDEEMSRLNRAVWRAAAELRKQRRRDPTRRQGAELDVVISRCRRLLEMGEAVGSVAELLEMCEKDVAKVLGGRHPTQRKLRRRQRCPGCGALVKMPCVACQPRGS